MDARTMELQQQPLRNTNIISLRLHLATLFFLPNKIELLYITMRSHKESIYYPFYLIYIFFIILTGFPTTTEYGGISLVTTEFSPILTPTKIVALSPIQTLSSIIISPFE